MCSITVKRRLSVRNLLIECPIHRLPKKKFPPTTIPSIQNCQSHLKTRRAPSIPSFSVRPSTVVARQFRDERFGALAAYMWYRSDLYSVFHTLDFEDLNPKDVMSHTKHAIGVGLGL